MLTFMQLKVAKAKRRLTQEQKRHVVDIEVARKFVHQAIEETLAAKRTELFKGLSGEDLDRIFNNQPVHFDAMGYVPHWFKRQEIMEWAVQIRRKHYPSDYQQKK